MADNGASVYQTILEIGDLIDLGTNFAKTAYTVIVRYRDIGEEVQHLVTDLWTLKGFLESPTDAAQGERLNQLRGTLKTCWELVGRLNKLMGHNTGYQSGRDAFSIDLEAGQQQQPSPVWTDKLKWIAVKDEALELLQQLKTQRQNIMLFLQIDVA